MLWEITIYFLWQIIIIWYDNSFRPWPHSTIPLLFLILNLSLLKKKKPLRTELGLTGLWMLVYASFCDELVQACCQLCFSLCLISSSGTVVRWLVLVPRKKILGCVCVSPAMNWGLVQGVPPPLPEDAGIGSSTHPPHRKWMDGWMDGWMDMP